MTITLKAARAGVITGVLLALARIAGETAPLLFTALSNQFWTTNLRQPMASLPVHHLQVRDEPVRELAEAGMGGVFLITLGVLRSTSGAGLLPQQTLIPEFAEHGHQSRIGVTESRSWRCAT
jgi:ABC-type phosphate transport system permease subunit